MGGAGETWEECTCGTLVGDMGGGHGGLEGKMNGET